MHPIAKCRLWFVRELMVPKAGSGARPIALDAGALQVVELWLLIGYRTRSYCCVEEFTSNVCDREPWRPLTWMLNPEFVNELHDDVGCLHNVYLDNQGRLSVGIFTRRLFTSVVPQACTTCMSDQDPWEARRKIHKPRLVSIKFATATKFIDTTCIASKSCLEVICN